MNRSKVTKIITAIDRLDAADQAAVRRYLAAGKRLTAGGKTAYNAAMPTKMLASKRTDATGRKIAEARKAASLTQKQLAAAAGISWIALAFIETGKRRARETTLRCIAAALGLPIDDLIAA